MVLTMKLTSFAYNMYDGTADKQNVFHDVPHTDKNLAKICKSRANYAITKLPNPLEFFGYVYEFLFLALYMKLSPNFSINLLHDADFIRTVPYYKRFGILMIVMLTSPF